MFIICPNLWHSLVHFFLQNSCLFFSLANTSVDLVSNLLKFHELNLAYYYHSVVFPYFIWEEKIIVDYFLNHSDFTLERIRRRISNHFENVHII